MKTISYLPSRDQLSLRLGSLRGTARREFGRYTLWLDKDGAISALDIRNASEELEEFTARLGTIRLGGIWKGVRISDEDIKEVRRELLGQIEERW